ncbi:hypothetical protein GWI33_012103 [Rhynchophorus ferrugineus]|uniref:Uncharacterized protein n=1 Tax=Rhynchophorus ferrugineus TaxID=354439 RepID=A0A834IC28_RHYFE|nr:hypothetical protein GWI33_012103 [Rhynchophorus ferrugineus]
MLACIKGRSAAWPIDPPGSGALFPPFLFSRSLFFYSGSGLTHPLTPADLSAFPFLASPRFRGGSDTLAADNRISNGVSSN